MKNTTLHLGFNWQSPLIGAIWGRGQLSAEYRALQYALANDSDGGKPAWFQFELDDVLRVLIWDLSSSPSSKELALKMSFSKLDAVATYDPSDLVQGSSATPLRDASNGEWYLSFNEVSRTSVPGEGPWGASSFVYAAGSFTFIKKSNYKLSYSLQVTKPDGGEALRVFLADPEVIVGSRGG